MTHFALTDLDLSLQNKFPRSALVLRGAVEDSAAPKKSNSPPFINGYDVHVHPAHLTL